MATNWAATQLTNSLKRLGQDFNEAFPRRDTATDGAYGDRDHQSSPSGHNLDDTPGSRPESEDADSKPELRALDVDADLNARGVTMQAVADRIIATAADRVRLSYLIYSGRIAGRHTGWKWIPYSGSNPHDSHLHASGHPDHDENDAPWTSVRNFGEDDDDMANADDVIKKLDELMGMVRDANPGPGKSETVNGGLSRLKPVAIVQGEVRNAVKEIRAALNEGAPEVPADSLKAATTNQLMAELQSRVTR